MTSSRRRREYMIATLRREEVERQNAANIRLAEQKFYLEQQRHQVEMQAIKEENRRRLTEAKLLELELSDDISDGSHRSVSVEQESHIELNDHERVQTWVNTVPSENLESAKPEPNVPHSSFQTVTQGVTSQSPRENILLSFPNLDSIADLPKTVEQPVSSINNRTVSTAMGQPVSSVASSVPTISSVNTVYPQQPSSVNSSASISINSSSVTVSSVHDPSVHASESLVTSTSTSTASTRPLPSVTVSSETYHALGGPFSSFFGGWRALLRCK